MQYWNLASNRIAVYLNHPGLRALNLTDIAACVYVLTILTQNPVKTTFIACIIVVPACIDIVLCNIVVYYSTQGARFNDQH